MVPKWYVRKNDKSLGPYPASELKQMATSGQLRSTDLVQKEGADKWLPAAALKGLFTPADASPPALVQPRANSTSQRRGSRVGLIFMTLLAIVAFAGAGWFFVQSQQYLAQLDKAEDKLRLLVSQKPQPSTDAGTLPARPVESAKQGGEQEAQLRAQLQKFKEQGDKDAYALEESRKNIAQLQAKSQQDALAMSALQTNLRDFQAEMLKRLEQQLKQRIAELDKKSLAQEETLTALRKSLGLGESDEAPQELIDKYALAAGAEAEQSVHSLAKYLAAPFRNDREKTRAIYRWMTERIGYDVPAFLASDYSKQSAEDVLVSRKAMCMGYAYLFEKLCRLNEIEVAVISGEGGSTPTTKHGWNAVKIQGKWQLIDVTWAAGNVKNNAFEKVLNDAYFLPAPEMMILGHLPTDPQWQLLEPPLSEQEVRTLFTLPRPALMKMQEWGVNGKALVQLAVKNEVFRANLQRVNNSQLATLQRLGMLSGEQLLETLGKEKFAGLVTAGFPPGMDSLQVHKAPLNKELLAGTTLHVELSGAAQAAIIMNGKFFHLTGKGNLFAGSIVLQPGDLKIGVLPAGQTNPYRFILVYSVVEGGKK